MLEGSTLDPLLLRRAIEATFERHKMAMPSSLPTGLSDAFVTSTVKSAQRKAFLKKNRLEAIALDDMVTRLRDAFHNTGVI